ncbi:PPK2 family polyphosphate kinase [Protaetiibacter intestinalis]|uniref:Polyphosphate kinase 2 family protein n=1 Tax=Protaetiibacter intestinalis TaxID=2419774 RepID=A0A387B6Y0_9MICO|nr:PPK2 family polyphosphate kinase [Protaetiibacter intestinalis]AYF98103.1 polyphosphate kinase 2 family protein [Protaetiibacter intestinalis]
MSFVDELRVGAGFRLAEVDPDSTPGFSGDRDDGEKALAKGAAALGGLQELLFANTEHDPRSVLLVLQAMDTAGKGGIVRHVVGSVDPQGVHIHAFKKPTPEELAHDFLWRVERELPGPGRIGVFDRSHYEDVLIGRVRQLADAAEIERRYGAINEFEERVAASGTVIVKVMLHISADEQRDRLAERLERPDKYWKFNPGDLAERALWDQYQDAYQLVFERTDTEIAPWHVVPANHKWFARLSVAQLLTDALRSLGQDWPPADFDVEEQKQALGV